MYIQYLEPHYQEKTNVKIPLKTRKLYRIETEQRTRTSSGAQEASCSVGTVNCFPVGKVVGE